MAWRRGRAIATGLAAVLAAVASGGCRPRDARRSPRVEITTVPPADKGGPDLLDVIAGRVADARAGERVVVFSRSRVWWVQPGARQPYTAIGPDGTWKSSTHLGMEYAAFLVDASYVPPTSAEVLPREGAGIVAVTV